MQVGLDIIIKQLEYHCIDSELIIVEWNPPIDKPSIMDVIKLPLEKLKYCTVRLIVVPNNIHKRYPGHEKIPLNVVAAINCAIRRARGEYILPRNIDLIYSEELISYIASKKLKKDERYRLDRYDVNKSVLNVASLKEQLEYCKNNIVKINSQTPKAKRNPDSILPDLHTNASGDFQLMSRHYWHLLHGYYDFDIVGGYGDGLLCYTSYAIGVKEIVLKDPMRLYHIEHDDAFNERLTTHKLPLENWLSFTFMPTWFNRILIGLYRRVLNMMGYKVRSTVHGVPTLGYAEYQKKCKEIILGKSSYILNDENWGLGKEILDELVINTANWDEDNRKN